MSFFEKFKAKPEHNNIVEDKKQILADLEQQLSELLKQKDWNSWILEDNTRADILKNKIKDLKNELEM